MIADRLAQPESWRLAAGCRLLALRRDSAVARPHGGKHPGMGVVLMRCNVRCRQRLAVIRAPSCIGDSLRAPANPRPGSAYGGAETAAVRPILACEPTESARHDG